jgi:hypothetical protein
MMALDVPGETWAGIVGFYSIIHISRGDDVRGRYPIHLSPLHLLEEAAHMK